MFGLDDYLASFSDGTTLVLVVAVAEHERVTPGHEDVIIAGDVVAREADAARVRCPWLLRRAHISL